MQKWEYKIQGTDLKILDTYEKVAMRQPNTMSEQNTRIEKWLNELGKDGWELINIKIIEGTSTPIREDTYNYYFKRPLND